MMFADYGVLIDTNISKGKLKYWREVLKKNQLKISKAKIEIFEFKF